jgi:hypothetical protein
MPFYEMTVQTVAATTGNPAMAIRAPTNPIKVWEIFWEITAATATTLALYRNTNTAYAATTSTSAGQATDLATSHAGTAVLDTAWSGAPAVTTTRKIRRYTVPATIGAGCFWKFRNGLIVRDTGAITTDMLVLRNDGAATCSVATCHVAWEE